MPQPSASADVRLKRMTLEDVRKVSPAIRDLRHLVLNCKDMYPEIDRWFDAKVLPGVLSGARAAFVAYVAGIPVASAVVKVQSSAKFCHLRVVDDLQDLNLGALFFSIMALESRHSKSIHFTLPESLWQRRQGFFQAFGFSRATPSGTQYRLFDRELCCAARLDDVWGAALSRIAPLSAQWTIAGHEFLPKLLMSIKPPYADAILAGRKTVEVRKRFSGNWAGSRVALYATAPLQALVGDAEIASVVSDEPHQLWQHVGHQMGCSESDFLAYAGDAPRLAAVVLQDIRPYRMPLMKAQLERLARCELRPPQSYCATATDQGWSSALGVAALLHATTPETLTSRVAWATESLGTAKASKALLVRR